MTLNYQIQIHLTSEIQTIRLDEHMSTVQNASRNVRCSGANDEHLHRKVRSVSGAVTANRKRRNERFAIDSETTGSERQQQDFGLMLPQRNESIGGGFKKQIIWGISEMLNDK